MKHTPLRRGAALLLCLTMLMGLLPGLLTRAHAAPSVDWPQITSFAVKDSHKQNLKIQAKSSVSGHGWNRKSL